MERQLGLFGTGGMLAWLAASACSGATLPSIGSETQDAQVPCGVGAVSQGGSCLAEDASARVDSTAEGAAPDSGGGTDAGSSDAGSDSLVNTTDATADPCPNSNPLPGQPVIWFYCEQKCAPAPTDICKSASCGPTLDVPFGRNAAGGYEPLPFTFRTPDAPGIDPNCATQCPGGGFAYELGFTANALVARGDGLKITVAPPWEIIVGSQAPFCTDQTAKPPQSCVAIGPTYKGSILIVTKDPAAPARNVLVEGVAPGANVCP
jgi:hypothetical protein